LAAYSLAVEGRDVVEDLVDEPHGVDVARQNRPLGVTHQVAVLVHGLGEESGGEEIREHHVAGG